jgi:DNA polymerase-3 subunit alpha
MSLYDAIGSPESYAEWMLKNAGEDSGAFAITDHGNMNAIGNMVSAQKKYNKSGTPVKMMFGVEAYYIPSLSLWEELKRSREEEKKKKKQTNKTADEEDLTSLVIENEEESKSKFFDPINRRNHLVLVAANQEGLKNLFRLVTRSYREGFYRKPRIDFEMLKKFNSGLVASTACLAGIPSFNSLRNPGASVEEVMKEYDKDLLPLMDIFGKDRFFLELQFNKIPEQQIVNKHIVEYSKRTGYNLIAAADCHYPSPDMFKDREIYRLLGYQMQNSNIDLSILEKKPEDLEAELYLKNGDQMFQAYKNSDFGATFDDDKLIIDAIQRTYDIAHDYIENVSPDDSIKLPKTFQITEQVATSFDYLKNLILDGLKSRNLTSKEYVDRAVFELKVIKNLKVEEYFLAMKEIIDALRKNMLLGTARGSGAGSLVNYLLGITLIDPIKNELLFERFLSPSRAELPDVDSDLELKEESLEILKEHFGADSVLAISNYNQLKLKSLIKDVAKLYGVPFQEVNSVTTVAESEARAKILKELGGDQKLYEFTFEKAKQYSPTFNKFLQKYPKLGEHITNLFRETKAISRHAGGILVVPDAESHLPIVRIRGVDQSPIVEGMTAQHLKHFGLVKFDILGLATLKIIRRTIEIVLQQKGINPSIENIWDFYNKNLHPDVINPSDEKVFDKVYCAGHFPSIFQFEKESVQKFCTDAKPKNVSDIAVLTSIWRPGPLAAGAHRKYLYADENEIKKEHPIIQEVLGQSRGLLCFQEQFMLLAHKLAGFTLEESDQLRKILVKPSHELGEELKKKRIEYREKFIEGAIGRGLAEDRATRLWDDEIAGFISYGFNKSHAISYAYNSYQCAWLYTYHEKEWIKACLERDPELEKTINTVRGLGYSVENVDVNFSAVEDWNFVNNSWRPPLNSLKGVGVIAAREIASQRPAEGFKTIYDFFYDAEDKWRWKKVNKKVVGVLMKSESFNSLSPVGTTRTFKNYKHMHDFVLDGWAGLKTNKVNLTDAAHGVCSDWTSAEKVIIQRELKGFYDKELIIGRFLDTFKEFEIKAIDEYGATDIDEEEYKGPLPKVWAVVEAVVQKMTKTNKPFLVVAVSGLSEKMFKFKIWNMEKKESGAWTEGSVVIFSLDYDENFGYSLSRNGKVMQITR